MVILRGLERGLREKRRKKTIVKSEYHCVRRFPWEGGGEGTKLLVSPGRSCRIFRNETLACIGSLKREEATFGEKFRGRVEQGPSGDPMEVLL